MAEAARGKAGTMTARRLHDFEGAWRYARRISHADGRVAEVSGRAVWWWDGAGLVCDETGEMRVPGYPPIQVARRSLWREGLAVHFADGRVFHHVPPEGGETAHWCDPDQYDGCYDFTDWPRFCVSWRVRGPNKDYHMTTEYRREAR